MRIFNGIRSLFSFWGWANLFFVPAVLLSYAWCWASGTLTGLIATGIAVIGFGILTVVCWNDEE